MYLNILGTLRVNNFDPKFVEKVTDFVKDLPLDKDYAVIYHNYDGNYKDDYDMSFANISTIKAGFNHRVPDNEIVQFASMGDHSSVKLADVWKQIWDLEDDGALKRDYIEDLELHLDGQITIFLHDIHAKDY